VKLNFHELANLRLGFVHHFHEFVFPRPLKSLVRNVSADVKLYAM
jgi:hypothetical protein